MRLDETFDVLARSRALTARVVETLGCEEQNARIDALFILGLEGLFVGDVLVAQGRGRLDLARFGQTRSEKKVRLVGVVCTVDSSVGDMS